MAGITQGLSPFLGPTQTWGTRISQGGAQESVYLGDSSHQTRLENTELGEEGRAKTKTRTLFWTYPDSKIGSKNPGGKKPWEGLLQGHEFQLGQRS